MRLTDAELRELLEMESKATPGPWPPQNSTDAQTRADYDLLGSARNLARPLAEEVLRLRELLREARRELKNPEQRDSMTDLCIHEIEEALRDAD